MSIRIATRSDTSAISDLLKQSGYPVSVGLLAMQLDKLFGHLDHRLLVYELEEKVVALISVHYVPQLIAGGEMAWIGFMAVAKPYRRMGIGRVLEMHVSDAAGKRGCTSVSLGCRDWQSEKLQSYIAQGYREYANYLSKRLA